MNGWQAIVFDLDDTLYPERDYVMSGFGAAAAWAEEALNIPHEQGFRELKTLFEQGVRGSTFDQWLRAHDVPGDDMVPKLVSAYREHEPILTPFLGVPELLASLRQTFRLGLVSDGHLSVQRRKLAALGLAAQFDAVVFSDEWGRDAWKPNALPFNVVFERLETTGSRAMYVGDNPDKDFIGARRVGMWTVRVRHPLGLHARVEPVSSDHAPDVEIENIAALKQIVAHADGTIDFQNRI